MRKCKFITIIFACSLVMKINAISLPTLFQTIVSTGIAIPCTVNIIGGKKVLRDRLAPFACLIISLYAVHVYFNIFRYSDQGPSRWVKLPVLMNPKVKIKDNAFNIERVNKKIGDTNREIHKGEGFLEKAKNIPRFMLDEEKKIIVINCEKTLHQLNTKRNVLKEKRRILYIEKEALREKYG